MKKKERETKFDKLCKCGKYLKFTISSPTGSWWFTCGKCGKYYWQGAWGFLNVAVRLFLRFWVWLSLIPVDLKGVNNGNKLS